MNADKLRQAGCWFPLRRDWNVADPLENVLISLNLSGKVRGDETVLLETHFVKTLKKTE